MKRCSKCGSPKARHKWITHPCALDNKKLVFRLCRRCDIALNHVVLVYANVRNKASIIKQYGA